MDDNSFYSALLRYQQPGSKTTVCRPSGVLVTNTGSGVLEFGPDNIASPPLRVQILASSDRFNTLFDLKPHLPKYQAEILKMLKGQSETYHIFALRITNNSVCKFLCAKIDETATDNRPPTIYALTLCETTEYLRLRIDCGSNIAYLLEQNRPEIQQNPQALICCTNFTKVVDGQKEYRLDHTHKSNAPNVSSSWGLTKFDPNPT